VQLVQGNALRITMLVSEHQAQALNLDMDSAIIDKTSKHNYSFINACCKKKKLDTHTRC